ncbi:MAG: MDR family MFS transporter [Polyangiaceae bacterium]
MPVGEAGSSRKLTVVAILLSMFMSAMEATVVATAMPSVIAQLRGIELYGWVGATYMLTMTVSIPTWGKLADRLGRKPVMLAGHAFFMLGSIGSGAATSMWMLIVMRAIQGIGAGSLQPVALTIVGDIFTVEERGRIQGLFGAVWGFSAMIGPLLGGVIVSALSWRWVFFLNVPFGVLSAAILIAFYREGKAQANSAPTRKPLDLAGAITLSVAVVALLLGAGGTLPILTVPLAIGATVLFVVVERRSPDPILPMPLLSEPVVRSSTILGALMGATMMVTLMYTPLYVAAVLGGSPTDAGSSVAPMLIGWPIASAVSGRLIGRFGYRPLVRIGLFVVGAGCLMLLGVTGAGPWALRGASFLAGVGMGLSNTALIIAVQSSVGHQARGVATASTLFARSIGGAVAVGATGALVAALLRGRVPEHLLDELLSHDRSKVDPSVIGPYLQAITDALKPTFMVMAGLGVLSSVAGWFFPNVAPHSTVDKASSDLEAAG